MSTVCFCGSSEHIYYSIIESEDGYEAEVDDRTNKIQHEEFSNFLSAKCWIIRIINEHKKESNEIDRYN